MRSRRTSRKGLGRRGLPQRGRLYRLHSAREPNPKLIREAKKLKLSADTSPAETVADACGER